MKTICSTEMTCKVVRASSDTAVLCLFAFCGWVQNMRFYDIALCHMLDGSVSLLTGLFKAARSLARLLKMNATASRQDRLLPQSHTNR